MDNTIIHEISLSGYKAASDGMLDLGTWGSYGVEKLHCTFDEAWRELTITAFFNVKGEVVGKALVGKDGYADVPWEATKENTFAGRIVFEGSMDGQRRITTDLNFKVTNHSSIADVDSVPTEDRWNQFVTQCMEYRDGAYEAATKAEARAEDAAAASEDAQAAMRAAKASEDAAAASQNAAKGSEDKAKASADAVARSESNASTSERAAAASAAAAAASEVSAAESAKNAASAAKKAADESVAANIATIKQIQSDVTAKQNNAAASATAAADAEQGALAAQAAAETAVTNAGTAATRAETAAGTATAAATDAGDSADEAAQSKAAAETAAQAAKEAQAAAAAARADAVKAQTAAQAAAKTAQDAQSAAEKARDDAQTARQGAEDARDAAAGSAEAAAKSEENAKQSADTLAESVKNVAANTAAVAELREKKAEIDDTAVGADGWSSKHIVDMLCPKIDESGNPVQCYPVAGYPLGVKASWEPVQEGEGEPSPENIRPIVGRNSVTVERCGENVIEFLSTEDSSSDIKIAADAEKNITLNGTLAKKGNVTIGTCRLHWVAGKTYTMYIKKVGGSASLGSGDGITFAYSLFTENFEHYFRGDTSSTSLDAYMASGAALVETELVFMLQCWRANTVFNNYKFQIEVVEGTTAPTTYEPYTGQTNTLTLPETVYGGEVDAVSGSGERAWKLLTLDGTEHWMTNNNIVNGVRTFFVPNAVSDIPIARAETEKCTHYRIQIYNDGKESAFVSSEPYAYICTAAYSSIEDLSAYLATQYAAGTPVQIAYKLATPVPFTATGGAELPALDGANTVITDADSVDVTGRADPIKRIADLEAAVASIE